MFGLFKKKEPEILVIDKVWMNKNAKLANCLTLLHEKPSIVFITWFNETYIELNKFLEENNHFNKVRHYRNAISIENFNYIFFEHYPIKSKEDELFKKLNLQQVTVLSSLSEPLFKAFNAENILAILKKLGMNENDVIEHSLITTSIKRGQEKIESKLLIEQTANSQEDWLAKNYKEYNQI